MAREESNYGNCKNAVYELEYNEVITKKSS